MAIEVPIPDYEDPKEIWALYGLAAYSANLIEQSLINLAVVLQLPSVNLLSRDIFESTFHSLDKKTLGQLIHAARKVTTFPEHLDRKLTGALSKRNYLIHQFFQEHAEDAMSATGRRDMIDELVKLIKLFGAVDPILENIYMPLWEKYGVDEEFMKKEWNKMQARVNERDSS